MEKVLHIWSLFVCLSILRRNKTNNKHLQTKYAKISVVWVLGKMLFLKSSLSSSVWNLTGSNRDNKQRSGLFGCALLVNLALLAAIVYLLGKRGARGVKDRETLQSLVCSTNPLFLCNTAGCSLHDPLCIMSLNWMHKKSLIFAVCLNKARTKVRFRFEE